MDLQDGGLHLVGQRGGHAVDVNLVRVQALGLEEKLVRRLVGKLDDLVLDRGTISRSDRFDLAAVHGRAMDVLADDAVGFRGGERDVARHLAVGVGDPAGAEAEGRGVGIAGLRLEARPVDGAAVEARRRAGLQPAAAQAELLDVLAQQHRGRLAAASGGNLLLAAVDQAIEKRAGGDDDGVGGDRAAVAQDDSATDATRVFSRRSSVVGA